MGNLLAVKRAADLELQRIEETADLEISDWPPTPQACRRLNCHRNSLLSWFNKGLIRRFTTPGGQHRWDVRTFIAERVQDPRPRSQNAETAR